MKKQPASIFNEVFGPIMTGPSSSHTAGPARIGMMAHQMLTDELADIEILFDQDGSFAAQYEAQGSNFGFVGGILGIDIADETIKRSLIMAEEQGIGVKFRVENLERELHPNYARILLTMKNRETVQVEANSTGGGMFEVISYYGIPVHMRGDYFEYLLFMPELSGEEGVKKLLEGKSIPFMFSAERDAELGRYLVNIKFDQPVPRELRDEIKGMMSADHSQYLEPVLPVVKQIGSEVPFINAEEALEYTRKHNCELWELACVYESALSGKTNEEVLHMMSDIASIMRDSALKGMAGGYNQRGFLSPKAGLIEKNMRSGNGSFIDLGVLNKAAVWATAVMEYDICMGRVVAAPTGGSSGVLPGAVVAVGEEVGKSDEEIAKALLVGGLIGVFIDHQATFAAEIAACQAENGAGSSMAAAAVIQMLGGTVEEGFAAASLALQNMLGLICDPVAGTGNVPCVGRNASATANALVSANMVSCGFDPAIPLDEVIQTMLQVGHMLPPELRCTGKGGLCLTLTAKKIVETLDLTPVLK